MHGHQIYSVFYTIQSLLVLLFLKTKRCYLRKIMPGFQEKSPLKSEKLLQSTVYQDFYYHSIISSIGAKNPNPSPIGKRFGFLVFGGGRWMRWLALRGKAIRRKPVCELVCEAGHRPVGFRWVRIRLSAPTKKTPPKAMSFSLVGEGGFEPPKL